MQYDTQLREGSVSTHGSQSSTFSIESVSCISTMDVCTLIQYNSVKKTGIQKLSKGLQSIDGGLVNLQTPILKGLTPAQRPAAIWITHADMSHMASKS